MVSRDVRGPRWSARRGNGTSSAHRQRLATALRRLAGSSRAFDVLPVLLLLAQPPRARRRALSRTNGLALTSEAGPMHSRARSRENSEADPHLSRLGSDFG